MHNRKNKGYCLSSNLTGVLKVFKFFALRLQQAILLNIHPDCIVPVETFLLIDDSFTIAYE